MQKKFLITILSFALAPTFVLAKDELAALPVRIPNATPAKQSAAPRPQDRSEPTLRNDCNVEDVSRTEHFDSSGDWGCGPPSKFWVRGEYLLWRIKDSQAPILITSGVPGATPLPGVLGQPGTTVLFGGNDLDNQERSGGRFTAGFWFNDCHSCGIEGSYFFLASRSVRFDDTSTLIARPFFDVLTGLQNAQLVAFPGIATGEIHLNYSNSLQGAEVNMLCIPCWKPRCKTGCAPCVDQSCAPSERCDAPCNDCCSGNHWMTLIGGFRYLQFDESLGISETARVNPALAPGNPFFGGSTISMTDQFDTNNNFFGAQIGAQAEYCCGPIFVNVLGKIAVGMTNEVVEIRGSTSITSPAGVTVVTPAGFLATGSNSGRFTRNAFALVPEVGINVGSQITRNLRGFIGYTFLYCSSVARVGDQIDTGLSGTQIPTDARFNPQAGPARPAAVLRDTDFWAQGINIGMEFRY